MDHVKVLIQRCFGQSTDELYVGGVPVTALVAQFGSPLYVYDIGVIDRTLALLRSTVPQKFAIYYSMKANPNPAIVSHFVGRGCGLEVASGGEFHRAVAAGCAVEKILFAGPGKTEAELELVLRHGIGEIHSESVRELDRVSTISRRLGVQARVAIRVNPSAGAQGAAMRMGGKPAPFGVDEEQLDAVLDRILGDPAIQFQGIHLFTGTQILNHELLLGQYRNALEIAKKVALRIERPLERVDLGGGLGIPYFPNESELNMKKFAEDLKGLSEEIERDPMFHGTEFIIEPGRYLVGEAGIYITRVNDIKVSRGKTFVIVDGGMNHHLAASGNLGQVLKRNFPLALVNRLRQEPAGPVDVVGPLCTPLDTLARDVQLPSVNVGDLVGIFQSGAYALTASPSGFLSHPPPPEVLVEQGVISLTGRNGSAPADYKKNSAEVCIDSIES